MVCFGSLPLLSFLLLMSSCSLSCVLSIIVIFFIIKKELFRAHSYKILIYISINDFLRSFIGLLELMAVYNSVICSLYGYIDMYLFTSNIIWAFCLTFTIFQIIVLEETNFEKYHKIWIFFNVFVVGGIDALPFITHSFGNYGGYCQMAYDEMGNIWRFSILYIPVSIILGIIFVLIFKIMRKIKRIGNISIRSIILDRGIIYILVILVAFVPFLAFRIFGLFEKGCALDISTVFLMFLYFLQGFLNGVVFFYNKTIRSIIFSRRNESLGSVNSDISSLRISFSSTFNEGRIN